MTFVRNIRRIWPSFPNISNYTIWHNLPYVVHECAQLVLLVDVKRVMPQALLLQYFVVLLVAAVSFGNILGTRRSMRAEESGSTSEQNSHALPSAPPSLPVTLASSPARLTTEAIAPKVHDDCLESNNHKQIRYLTFNRLSRIQKAAEATQHLFVIPEQYNFGPDKAQLASWSLRTVSITIFHVKRLLLTWHHFCTL